MSLYLSELFLRCRGDDKWELMAPLTYQSDFLGQHIVVPKGYVTDLNTVNRRFPVIYSLFHDVGNSAAVIHDFLLTDSHILRVDADEVYKEALRVTPGVPRWKCAIMTMAVKLYGYFRRYE